MGIPFDTINDALTIHRCQAAAKYVSLAMMCYTIEFNASTAALSVWLWAVPVDGVQSTNSAEDFKMIVQMQAISYRYVHLVAILHHLPLLFNVAW